MKLSRVLTSSSILRLLSISNRKPLTVRDCHFISTSGLTTALTSRGHRPRIEGDSQRLGIYQKIRVRYLPVIMKSSPHGLSLAHL